MDFWLLQQHILKEKGKKVLRKQIVVCGCEGSDTAV